MSKNSKNGGTVNPVFEGVVKIQRVGDSIVRFHEEAVAPVREFAKQLRSVRTSIERNHEEALAPVREFAKQLQSVRAPIVKFHEEIEAPVREFAKQLRSVRTLIERYHEEAVAPVREFAKQLRSVRAPIVKLHKEVENQIITNKSFSRKLQISPYEECNFQHTKSILKKNKLSPIITEKILITNEIEKIIGKYECPERYYNIEKRLDTLEFKLMEKIDCWRYSYEQERNYDEMFSIFNSRIVSIEIKDPWVGARPESRKSLSKLLSSINEYVLKIISLKITLSTNRSNTNNQDIQLRELRRITKSENKIKHVKFCVRNDAKFKLHDRYILIRTDDNYDILIALFDVSSGIDHLMNDSKECVVYRKIFP